MSDSKKQREESQEFLPQFNADNLIPCITQSAKTGQVLMMAWMNEEAIQQTLKSGEMHYWSRSRQELWHKGATSGHTQRVIVLKTDCDQDCILALVETDEEPEIACHTGRQSCFYRSIAYEDDLLGLKFIDQIDAVKDL